MNTAGGSHLHDTSDLIYDPDEVLPKNSPLLTPVRPTLRPSVTPPPIFSLSKVRPSLGDAVLVKFLDDGKHPEIAYRAGCETLPSDDSEEEASMSGESECWQHLTASGDRGKSGDGIGKATQTQRQQYARQVDTGASIDLKSLAQGALAFATAPGGRQESDAEAGCPPPVRQYEAAQQRQAIPAAVLTMRQGPSVDPCPYSPPNMYSTRESGSVLNTRSKSPKSLPLGGHSERLPPIQLNSPTSDTSGKTALPSIKSHVGDFEKLASDHIAEQARSRRQLEDNFMMRQSPAANINRLPSMNGSPPISPCDNFRRDSMATGYPLHAATHPYYLMTGHAIRTSDFTASASEGAGQGQDQTRVRPTSTNANADRTDATATPPGTYVCRYPGCTAAPFHTQYLLNSHANVHSQERPHYCPVTGCPRSEGGKGFKRKNEMIRHGLVHESPGYVCPFCPDREHKYPRPDNLQRHVRVHHSDRDKDDPTLREVLSQRPDGLNRGRRRRGVPT